MNEHEKINYVEFPTKDIETAKAFFTAVFGWSFVDYGPEYTTLSNEAVGIGNDDQRMPRMTNAGFQSGSVAATSRMRHHSDVITLCQ